MEIQFFSKFNVTAALRNHRVGAANAFSLPCYAFLVHPLFVALKFGFVAVPPLLIIIFITWLWQNQERCPLYININWFSFFISEFAWRNIYQLLKLCHPQNNQIPKRPISMRQLVKRNPIITHQLPDPTIQTDVFDILSLYSTIF